MFDKICEYLGTCNQNVFRVAEFTDEGIKEQSFTPTAINTFSYSVTKSFVSLGTGILYTRGIIDVEDKIYDILKEKFPADHDKKWEDVTIKNLLQHRSGLTRGFVVEPNEERDFNSFDLLDDVFAYPLKANRNDDMIYIDTNYYILSRMFKKLTGDNFIDFIRKEAMNPMKMVEYSWTTDNNGNTYGGDGLSIRTVDMAKLGWLYLNNGVYDGKRYLSEKWMDMARDIIRVDDNGGYGFATQRKTGSVEDYYFSGAYGQLVNIMPRTRRVVAVSSFGCDILTFIDVLKMWEDEELGIKKD